MIKYLTTLFILPVISLAGSPGIPADMQARMEQVQKAQACMQNIDPASFDRIEEEGRKKEAEVKALCTSGQRDKAQKMAINYSKEMMKSDEMKQVRVCGEMMRGMMPEMPYDNFEKEFQDKHVCDDI